MGVVRTAIAVLVIGAIISCYFVLRPGFVGLAYPSQGPEQLSPTKRISDNWINVQTNKVMVEIPGASVIRIADTNSMDPTLDAEATVLVVSPRSPDEIHVGDIIVYQVENNLIIHRVIETGYDDAWWSIVKGDNNPVPDPEKVRFEQVKGVVVGILY
jgi:hypothetical protein